MTLTYDQRNQIDKSLSLCEHLRTNFFNYLEDINNKYKCESKLLIDQIIVKVLKKTAREQVFYDTLKGLNIETTNRMTVSRKIEHESQNKSFLESYIK